MTQATADSSTEFAELVYSIIETWRSENPGADTISREVKRRINSAVREDNRRREAEYQSARTTIEAAVRDHQHNMLVGYRPRVAESYDTWFTRQQQLAKQRLAIEQHINAESCLTVEDRGQAVAALSVAHHAPSVPLLPVFTPHPPTGLQALRARVQARFSRLRLGFASDRERRRLGAWEQVHRERQEQAQRLAGPEAAGVLDVSRALGLYDHGVWLGRDTVVQQQTRLAELEATVSQLRAELAARSNEPAPSKVTHAPTEQQPVEQRPRGAEQVSPQTSESVNPVVGEGETTTGSTDSKLRSGETPAPPVETDSTTADLIGAAHPNVGVAQPKQAASTDKPIDPRMATTAQSASDGLDI